jgi:hypothetical protein
MNELFNSTLDGITIYPIHILPHLHRDAKYVWQFLAHVTYIWRFLAQVIFVGTDEAKENSAL